MKSFQRLFCVAALALTQTPALAGFDSGSTGADGAFAPATNTVVALPPNGVLNYTTVTIPAGVTVRFQRNSANTPVVMLASGLVKIAGTIDISGNAGTTSTKPVVLGVTNRGGVGGPGGFNGGMGGASEQNVNGGSGYGPGAGSGAISGCPGSCGSGGSFATAGSAPGGTCTAGPTYGSNAMLPVIGGSGGGGGLGENSYNGQAGSGGGGGGGALLLVSSTAVELTGQIRSVGGAGGAGTYYWNYYCGGGGSGGMVRIIAPAFSGAGSIDVSGASGSTNGGLGRSSIEVVPNAGTFNLAMMPSLAITTIGGVPVPANPSGSGDVTAPLALGNPLPVVVTASAIPVGTVVKLTLNNNSGSVTTVNTTALAGTLQASTATGSINIPTGSSVLMASTTYTLTVAMGEALKVYASGERVEKVSLAAVLGGEMRVTLITASGKEYPVPAAVLAMLPS